jgi:predicted aspartyl protease
MGASSAPRGRLAESSRRRYRWRMRPFSLLVFLLLAACADAGAANCGFVGRSTLPISHARQFPTVPATIDGLPTTLVVDTGAMQTVVSTATAERAHVVPDPRLTAVVTGIGGTASYRVGNARLMKLGDIPVSPATVTIMPQVPLADGNLGMDILGDVDLDIDLPNSAITLYRGLLCPGAKPPWGVAATELATDAVMSRRLPASARPRRLRVAIELDGKPALAVLDTGSGYSLATRAFAAKLGIGAGALATAPRVPMTGLSPDDAEGRAWWFRRLRIGAEQVNRPMMVVVNLENADFDVLLGMDYLAGHRIWMSYGARRVFVADR